MWAVFEFLDYLLQVDVVRELAAAEIKAGGIEGDIALLDSVEWCRIKRSEVDNKELEELIYNLEIRTFYKIYE